MLRIKKSRCYCINKEELQRYVSVCWLFVSKLMHCFCDFFPDLYQKLVAGVSLAIFENRGKTVEVIGCLRT